MVLSIMTQILSINKHRKKLSAKVAKTSSMKGLRVPKGEDQSWEKHTHKQAQQTTKNTTKPRNTQNINNNNTHINK